MLFRSVLMLGTNDCKTRFNASSKTIAKGLIQVIEKAKKYSSQPFELLIISPIHLGNGVGDDGFDPEFGHAALADAVYKTITESGLLEKGMDSSFCHIA